VAGTARADREVRTVDLPLVKETPPAPDWLPNGHAVKEWDRLAPILVANKLLTEGGLSALGMLCSVHGKLVQLMAAGESPTAALLSTHRNLTNDFGLTPVAQGKVKPFGKDDEANPFARNGKPQLAS
jgi:phage terminase small subunit